MAQRRTIGDAHLIPVVTDTTVGNGMGYGFAKTVRSLIVAVAGGAIGPISTSLIALGESSYDLEPPNSISTLWAR